MLDQASSRAPTQEPALEDYVERLARQRAGRVGVHIRLSQLTRANRRPHHVSLATDMFAGSVQPLEGRLFVLHNQDLVFIARTPKLTAIDRAIDRLRTLFSEDPVFADQDAIPESFCTWYRLEEDFESLQEAARQWRQDAEQAQIDYVRKDASEGLAPIDPELLARLEYTLGKTDMTNFARRQLVCTLIKGQPPQPLFEENYVSILELQNRITPGVNWLAEPWLFRRITHTLDRRLMAMLMKNDAPDPRPFSINLNVTSVLGPEFRHFDEIVSKRLRGRLVIEFNKLDVFADMGAFLFARDFLHERGFRVCLDGLTHLTLPYYNRARLGFDLIKLIWRPDGLEDMLPDMIPALRDIVREAGQARTILCRCDTASAINVGQQLGIVMFQGRYVDMLHGLATKRAAQRRPS